jgi:hypothetical protein
MVTKKIKDGIMSTVKKTDENIKMGGSEEVEVKKGKKSWSPSASLPCPKKSDKWVYRYCRDDVANVWKKQSEGWTPCNDVEGFEVSKEDLQSHKNGVTGGFKYNELVLMKMDKEMAKARKEYYEKETMEATKAVVGAKGAAKSVDDSRLTVKGSVDGMVIN